MLPVTLTDFPQNRELQIMRIVRHPNIVELKASTTPTETGYAIQIHKWVCKQL